MRIRIAVMACAVLWSGSAWAQSSQTSFTLTAVVGGECFAEMQHVEKIGQHLKVHFTRGCHKPHAVQLEHTKASMGSARVMYRDKGHAFQDKVSLSAEPVQETMDSLYILGAAKAGITPENLILSLDSF